MNLPDIVGKVPETSIVKSRHNPYPAALGDLLRHGRRIGTVQKFIEINPVVEDVRNREHLYIGIVIGQIRVPRRTALNYPLHTLQKNFRRISKRTVGVNIDCNPPIGGSLHIIFKGQLGCIVKIDNRIGANGRILRRTARNTNGIFRLRLCRQASESTARKQKSSYGK